MYTKKEKRKVENIIKEIARQNNVSEAQIRTDMQEAMNSSRNSPDPTAQAFWVTFNSTGTEPTLEEFILWTAAMAML